MARRRRRRFGSIRSRGTAKWQAMYRLGTSLRTVNVKVKVMRSQGRSIDDRYHALACVGSPRARSYKRSWRGTDRCGIGYSPTVTGAMKQALRHVADKLR